MSVVDRQFAGLETDQASGSGELVQPFPGFRARPQDEPSVPRGQLQHRDNALRTAGFRHGEDSGIPDLRQPRTQRILHVVRIEIAAVDDHDLLHAARDMQSRSAEHTSELQSLMRISYAVFCLKKKTTPQK